MERDYLSERQKDPHLRSRPGDAGLRGGEQAIAGLLIDIGPRLTFIVQRFRL
jgi:hypothetical protein